MNEVQSSVDALRNADTYALFGLFARFADFNYRLSDEPGERRDGVIVYDTQILPPDDRLNTIVTDRTIHQRKF